MAAAPRRMTFAASSFAQKLGTAVAVGVIGALFTALGYVPNAEQTAESQAGIVWLMSVIPAGFTLAGLPVIMVFYSLDNPAMARIQGDLAAAQIVLLTHAGTTSTTASAMSSPAPPQCPRPAASSGTAA